MIKKSLVFVLTFIVSPWRTEVISHFMLRRDVGDLVISTYQLPGFVHQIFTIFIVGFPNGFTGFIGLTGFNSVGH